MLKKQYVKSRKVAKVTFQLALNQIPEELPADNVFIVGEFNDWDLASTPMRYNKKKKTFTVTLDLEPGRQYQFRYFVDSVYWCNDWEADGYIASGFGHDNSVVSTPEQAQ